MPQRTILISADLPTPGGVIAARGLPKMGQLTRRAVQAEDEKMIGAVAAMNPDTMNHLRRITKGGELVAWQPPSLAP
jgi:hypothetical protein